MSEVIGIVGTSGSGKSTSIIGNEEINIVGLKPEETFYITVSGQAIPSRRWRRDYSWCSAENPSGNAFSSDNSERICGLMGRISETRSEIKNIVIDDAQFLMSFEFMERAKESGFTKFTELAQKFFNVINLAGKLRGDIKVFILTHSEEVQKDMETSYKIKTLGKLLDEKITIEGMFNSILYTHTEFDAMENKTTYHLVTNRRGNVPAKSPAGMFKELLIPNDLSIVANAIDSYYE